MPFPQISPIMSEGRRASSNVGEGNCWVSGLGVGGMGEKETGAGLTPEGFGT